MPGVIAAGHPQTAAAGAEILQQGGNAVDAAVAAAFASFVAESVLVNIGGGGVAHLYNPATGETTVYDFFSAMPGLNGQAKEIDFRQILVDFGPTQQPFYIGRGSVAVPGAVAGLCRMAADLGTMPLADLLAPAIRLARQGILLNESLEYVAAILRPIFTDTPELAALYAPTGRMITTGERLYLPQLAHTLEQLGQQGAGLFYTGPVGQKIVADQQAHGGLITETDLSAYRAQRLPSLVIDYRGFTICLPPAPSSGGTLIAFALKLLETVSLADIDHNSFEHLRLLIEVMRLTNLARAEWDPVNDLLAPENIRRYSRAILAEGETRPEVAGPSHTTHISVADAAGQVATITTSAGENSGFLVADTGVMLNNMLGEIDLHPGGFHRLAAGQRLMTMMSPTLVLRQGRPILALGSGGSNRLRTAILQVISNFIDFGLPLNRAVEASRIHFEDSLVQLEGGIPPASIDKLKQAGYTINCWPDLNMFFGGAHTIGQRNCREQTDWIAAGDPRRGGVAVII